MIHVYAFADGLRELPDLEGLDGAPLEAEWVDGLRVVTSRRDSSESASRSEAIVHGTVVEALVDRASAVLPVRFGEESPDHESLVRVVHERSRALRRNLDDVRGCVEVAVWIVDPDDGAQVAARTGTEYMHARRAALAAFDELEQALEGLVRRSTVDRDSAAYLVPRSGLAAVRERVQRYADAHPERTVVCTGPWAPYSFAGDSKS